MASRRIASCRRRAAAIASGSASHKRVEPAISLNSSVIVFDGIRLTPRGYGRSAWAGDHEMLLSGEGGSGAEAMTDLDGRYPHFSANRSAAPPEAEAKHRGDHSVSERVHLVGGAFWGSDPQAELTWLRASAPVYWDDRGQAWGL